MPKLSSEGSEGGVGIDPSGWEKLQQAEQATCGDERPEHTHRMQKQLWGVCLVGGDGSQREGWLCCTLRKGSAVFLHPG